MSKKYKAIAKTLGVHYLIGRWGFVWGSKLPDGFIFDPKFIPLDGWVTKKECVVEILKDRDYEL